MIQNSSSKNKSEKQKPDEEERNGSRAVLINLVSESDGHDIEVVELPWRDYEILARTALANYQTFEEYFSEVLRKELDKLNEQRDINEL